MKSLLPNRRERTVQSDIVQGWIFDIQRYSINDGPGIRTTVFFKGCPLSCLWCDNPESQTNSPQLLYLRSMCVNCHRCVAVCPTGATKAEMNGSGNIIIDRSLCQACGKCVEVCYQDARVIMGKQMTVEQVFDVVKKDTLFYRNSGGGVTCSGGEPTHQPVFLKSLLTRCQEAGLHTALDTCGYVDWKTMEEALEHVDLVLYDIKHMDSEEHRRLTGVGNELILGNLEKMAKSKSIWVRIPLIPDYNDSEENIRATGEFLSRIGIQKVDVAPYHQLGMGKYERLGLVYALTDLAACSEEQTEKTKRVLESYGLEVSLA